MYKRILIPTDGSKVARKAITGGIELARELRASVVGYCALKRSKAVSMQRGSAPGRWRSSNSRNARPSRVSSILPRSNRPAKPPALRASR